MLQGLGRSRLRSLRGSCSRSTSGAVGDYRIPRCTRMSRPLSSRRVGHLRLYTSSPFRVAKKLSATALHALSKVLLTLSPGTSGPLGEGIVPLPSDSEESTERRDWEGRLLRVDERELHSLSFAKKAAAFFKISRSVRSESFSRRSRSFSRSSRSRRCCGLSLAGSTAAAFADPFFFRLAISSCWTQPRRVQWLMPRSRAI